MTEALAPYRVVEIGGGVAGAYCGKLFADFGAHVCKLEPPQGDVLRSAEPAYFAWLNTNKQSLVCHPADALDALGSEVLAGCDVLIDARPRHEWLAGPLAHDRLRRLFPGLVIAAISWFGESGPYAQHRASDAACWAWAGLAKLVGPRDGPPSLVPGYPAQVTGGLSAFTGAMSALLARGDAGAGRRMSVSIHEACVALAEYQVALGVTGMPTGRLGLNRFAPTYPLGIFRCSKGWLGITIVTPAQWRSFCDLFGMQAAAGDPAYLSNLVRLRDADLLEPQFAPQLPSRTAEEWFEEGRRRFLPFVVVPTVPELLAQPVHRQREAFAPVACGTVQAQGPVLPQRLSKTPPRPGGAAPALGSSTMAAQAAGEGARVGAIATQGAAALPLAGIRVVDLSMGWAGPLVTRQLADLGAEVIKVEACQYPDWWRGTDFSAPAVADKLYEKRPPFLMMNRNKRGITLDLTTERGTALLRQLVTGAHAVVENYSSGVMRKLGLDYASLAQGNPPLVMMSMAAFGGSSPWADVRAYGSTLEHASGLPTLVGDPAWPPTSAHLAFGDPVGGLNATAALLIALDHQRRTGVGQHIDMSQVECMLPLMAHAVVQSRPGDAPPARLGNGHATHAPHGCYPCAGDDAWVFIGIEDDAQWQRLCRVAGLASLAADAQLRSAEGRRAQSVRIDNALAGWTRHIAASEAVAALQAQGICCAEVVSPFELPHDPHLLERGFWQSVQRPIAGSDQPQPSLAFREGTAAYAVRLAAPTLGRDNDAVLHHLLGLDAAERAELRAAGVIGEAAAPAHQRRARAAQT